MGTIDDSIRKAEEKQEQQREHIAYEKGKKRHETNQHDPSNQGGPDKDGYGAMTPREKEAYKRGHRGD